MFCQSICHVHLEGFESDSRMIVLSQPSEIKVSPNIGAKDQILTYVYRCAFLCVDKLICYGSFFSFTTFQPYVVESSIMAKMNVCGYLFMLFFYIIVAFLLICSLLNLWLSIICQMGSLRFMI